MLILLYLPLSTQAAQREEPELPHGADVVPLLFLDVDALLLKYGEDGLP
jgi:hypothetical protein